MREETHLVDVADLAVHDLTLERLHDDRGVAALEARLSRRRHDLAFADVRDIDDRDDVTVKSQIRRSRDGSSYSPMFTAACSFDVLVKLLLQVVLELSSKV